MQYKFFYKINMKVSNKYRKNYKKISAIINNKKLDPNNKTNIIPSLASDSTAQAKEVIQDPLIKNTLDNNKKSINLSKNNQKTIAENNNISVESNNISDKTITMQNNNILPKQQNASKEQINQATLISNKEILIKKIILKSIENKLQTLENKASSLNQKAHKNNQNLNDQNTQQNNNQNKQQILHTHKNQTSIHAKPNKQDLINEENFQILKNISNKNISTLKNAPKLNNQSINLHQREKKSNAISKLPINNKSKIEKLSSKIEKLPSNSIDFYYNQLKNQPYKTYAISLNIKNNYIYEHKIQPNLVNFLNKKNQTYQPDINHDKSKTQLNNIHETLSLVYINRRNSNLKLDSEIFLNKLTQNKILNQKNESQYQQEIASLDDNKAAQETINSTKTNTNNITYTNANIDSNNQIKFNSLAMQSGAIDLLSNGDNNENSFISKLDRIKSDITFVSFWNFLKKKLLIINIIILGILYLSAENNKTTFELIKKVTRAKNIELENTFNKELNKETQKLKTSLLFDINIMPIIHKLLFFLSEIKIENTHIEYINYDNNIGNIMISVHSKTEKDLAEYLNKITNIPNILDNIYVNINRTYSYYDENNAPVITYSESENDYDLKLNSYANHSETFSQESFQQSLVEDDISNTNQPSTPPMIYEAMITLKVNKDMLKDDKKQITTTNQ